MLCGLGHDLEIDTATWICFIGTVRSRATAPAPVRALNNLICALKPKVPDKTTLQIPVVAKRSVPVHRPLIVDHTRLQVPFDNRKSISEQRPSVPSSPLWQSGAENVGPRIAYSDTVIPSPPCSPAPLCPGSCLSRRNRTFGEELLLNVVVC
jgi:hypothetical protein